MCQELVEQLKQNITVLMDEKSEGLQREEDVRERLEELKLDITARDVEINVRDQQIKAERDKNVELGLQLLTMVNYYTHYTHDTHVITGGSVNGWHIKTAKLGGLSPSISNLSSLTLSTLGTVGTANMKIKNTQRVASAPPRENKVASLWLDREKSINGRVESPAKECTVGKVGKLKPSIFERRPTLTSSDSKDSKTPLTPPFVSVFLVIW